MPARPKSTVDNRWRFDADGRLHILVSEAYRIRLGYLFDPRLAVHSSNVEPLPHQITAVYEDMLPRQPLRFLLADDPGAGKTIMAGLLIRELIARGDVRRCLICAPGSLSEQWQDELRHKLHLDFKIVTRDLIEAAGDGNPFAENDRLIARLDQLSRNDELRSRLAQTDWDLIVCDEAHKMSATYFGKSLVTTRRYQLGKLLGRLSRHLLLMTATPHNGIDDDFDLFMRLLDPDRFAGRAPEGAHRRDATDLMRRMTKERLLTFDGEPLFPERRATSLNYDLSPAEIELYESVSAYVRSEFNRIEQLTQGRRRSAIGFALTILQRRLASSPAAIYRSLRRRREKLEARLDAVEAGSPPPAQARCDISLDDDLDDAPQSELETIETQLLDHASAADTAAQLRDEIISLRALERQAERVLHSGKDSKWRQLLCLLHDRPAMRHADGAPRKLVIFTEHRDTLDYLTERLTTAIGRSEAVMTIHGGTSRERRRRIEADFRHDPDRQILVATDAAGEGINLQSAHLMVNYDLPWNPNRLEQRFGRIHRIGQKEVCHLWNLVAGQTREGAVYQRLLEKLERERQTLNGQVFDVLGELFRGAPLRQLLIEAVRYGDQPETRERLQTAIDNATDQARVKAIVRDDLLVPGLLDTRKVQQVREEMERFKARKLQPHFIRAFFLEAFNALNGAWHERENGRYAINNVPHAIRQQGREKGLGPIARKYERICFDKDDIRQRHKPDAEFVCPGHALLDAVISLLLRRQRHILTRGAVLIDPNDPSDQLRALITLETAIRDALPSHRAEYNIISRDARFIEIDRAGAIHDAGPAPYLDYRPATAAELAQIQPMLEQDWLNGADLEARALNHARNRLIPQHLNAIREPRSQLLDKTEAAVQERLTRAIFQLDAQASELRLKEAAGKFNPRLSSQLAQQRADTLRDRLKQRKAQIQLERRISASPPIIAGAALIVPIGALPGYQADPEIIDTRKSEAIAMAAVLAAERKLGNRPIDVSGKRGIGYDIESVSGRDGSLRFIEVKGRRKGARDLTLTRNELLCALNSPEKFILALVEIDGYAAGEPRYVRGFPFRSPACFEEAVKVNLQALLDASAPPS